MSSWSAKYLRERFVNAIQWRMERLFPPDPQKTVHILPTLRCNLSCSYCTNNFGEEGAVKFQELTPEQWIEILLKINKNVIISGGEPTVYPGLVRLLNGIPNRLSVRLYSNLTFNPELLLQKLNRKIVIFGSCHPSHIPPEKIRQTVDRLAESKYISGSIHFIRTEENKDYASVFERAFAGAPWKTLIFPDKRTISPKVLMQEKRHVKCRQKIILIGPDGRRYPCSTKMFRRTGALADMLTEPFADRFFEIDCDNWGSCAYCDGQVEADTVFLD